MLIHAAKNHGIFGHGVSLSEEQTALARQRIRAERLEDRITIDIKSYTELDGSYDKISSIGMFEHLGIANHPAYFSTVHRLLKPGGVYLHHAITKRDKGSAKKTLRKDPGYKALIKYIFPGGELDTIGMTLGNLEAHNFLVYDVENLREHYAQTCRLWAERLQARFPEAIAEVGEPKARLWLLYLAGCSQMFANASTQLFQTVATKRARGPSGLPSTRADLYR
jgi:cyclopropane-fatty-acyl-phospholipid synthase